MSDAIKRARRAVSQIAICALTCSCAWAWASEAVAAPAPVKPVITVGDHGAVLRDGAAYRGIGINFFSAFSRLLENPKDTTTRDGFADLSKRGIPFVRFMACGFWPKDYALYKSDKETYFRLLDSVVKAAEEYKVGLIPSLFWCSSTVPDLVGEPRGQWGNPSSKTNAFMRQYVQEVVTRYNDSPAIWAWEHGNELSLDADLPNAADHRPPIVPDLGTPTSRSAGDDVTHDDVVNAYREFAKAVRQYDSARPITSGASLSRPAAEHLRSERKWISDSPEQLAKNLTDITPDPLNLACVHLYPMDRKERFSQKDTPYEQTLTVCMDTCAKIGKPLFVGEFGAPDDEKSGGPDLARKEFFEILAAIEKTRVPLAALWVYDLPQQESFINITPSNPRKYMLEAISQANRRIRLVDQAQHALDMRGGDFTGRLLDNEANEGREGAGFNPLVCAKFPGQNLFHNERVGLNFEHLFNGRAEDKAISKFTPRKDPSILTQHSATSVRLDFPAEKSAWGVEAEMQYTFAGESAVDMQFTATLTRPIKHLGYLAAMWASYMNHTRERRIHFYGVEDGREGWITFGDDLETGFETGTVSYAGVAPLPFEEGSETLNIIEHPKKHFLLPFYYGLVDGDGDETTSGDTMVYIMMFDQREPIRFAVWNFITNAARKPNPHSPAWDWQYVLRDPEPGKRYGYRARLVYKPFVDEEDVKREYERWSASLASV